ncbi:MAG TPA: hypothetical protein VN609_07165 [Propionibacteriaceae bacterium]|nr:hypothetical protein [Propionibacteriaceae bacterium]
MIRVGRKAYRAAWALVVALLVVGWAIYGILHNPNERFLIFMIVLTTVLPSNAAGLLRQRDEPR